MYDVSGLLYLLLFCLSLIKLYVIFISLDELDHSQIITFMFCKGLEKLIGQDLNEY